jgi:hypothetical protein
MIPYITNSWIAAAAGTLAAILIVVVAISLLRGWTFGKWMRRQIKDEFDESAQSQAFHQQIVSIIEKERESNHFRDSVAEAMKGPTHQLVSACVREHNESAEAHGTYRRMAQSFVQAHVAEQLSGHNDNSVAHHVALSDYPDRTEFQSAIARVEMLVANNQQIILEKLNHITVQIADLKARPDRSAASGTREV